MHNTRKISDDIYWLGASDRKLSLFENVFPVPTGVSYNSYLISDDKTVLVDTVDSAVSKIFFENLTSLLGQRKLDYIIVSHMEPDHCATLEEVFRRWPDVRIIGNSKTVTMIKQFFNFDIDGCA